MRKVLAAIFIAFISGCVNFTVPKVTYDGPGNQETDKIGSLVLIYGASKDTIDKAFLDSAPNTYSALSETPDQWLKFNALDQRVFAESLITELSRINLLTVEKISDSNIPARDINIMLAFTNETATMPTLAHFPTRLLSVSMQITSSTSSLRKDYEIDATEGDSIFEKVNTSGTDTKEKAAQKLLNRIIPDIETFLITEYKR